MSFTFWARFWIKKEKIFDIFQNLKIEPIWSLWLKQLARKQWAGIGLGSQLGAQFFRLNWLFRIAWTILKAIIQAGGKLLTNDP